MSPQAPHPANTRKPAARAGIALLLILASLLGLRAALPAWIGHRVNRPPAESARFRWEVRDVDVRMLSLAYEFEGVTLRKRGDSAPVFAAERVRSRFNVRNPFSSPITVDMDAYRPVLHLELGAEGRPPSADPPDWERMLGRLTLWRVSGITLHEGEIRLHDAKPRPGVELSASGVSLRADYLYRGGDDSTRRAGLGFVVVSVVPETFQWGLQGNTAVYASFWNRLLTAAAPPAPAAATWRVAAQWPRPHRPLTLQLAGALPATQPTVGRMGGGPVVRVALRQDPRLPEWSTAQLWARDAGWHQVRGPGKTTHSFYVFPDSAWQGPEWQERQQALRLRSSVTRAAAALPPETVRVPWPAAWFFGLFLLAAGYLWLEEKL